MRILKSGPFSRFAQKAGISDTTLKNTVEQLEKEQFDANLGGGVYKQRIARIGGGKSGAYRVIILFKRSKLTVFSYGFEKSSRSNITQSELDDFKKLGKIMFAMTDKQIDRVIKTGRYMEI
jgi:hypothetical protein